MSKNIKNATAAIDLVKSRKTDTAAIAALDEVKTEIAAVEKTTQKAILAAVDVVTDRASFTVRNSQDENEIANARIAFAATCEVRYEIETAFVVSR